MMRVAVIFLLGALLTTYSYASSVNPITVKEAKQLLSHTEGLDIISPPPLDATHSHVHWDLSGSSVLISVVQLEEILGKNWQARLNNDARLAKFTGMSPQHYDHGFIVSKSNTHHVAFVSEALDVLVESH